jgi:branched-chain amino acid aminotransferase
MNRQKRSFSGPRGRLVMINGKRTETISVFDHGFLYGDGVFDSFRIFHGKPFYLKKHIDRLFSSAQNLGIKIPYSKIKIEGVIGKIYRTSGLTDAFMRIIVTRGTGPQGILIDGKANIIIMCTQRAFRPLRKIKASISKIRKYSNDGLGGAKSLNYSQNAKALYDAKKKHCDEAIFFNEKGFLVEGTTSNIFIVKGKKLFTPSLKTGALSGITREIVMKKFPVIEKDLTKKDLFSADEVFLTGTADFVTSVRQIDRTRYTKFTLAKIVFKKIYSPFTRDE